MGTASGNVRISKIIFTFFIYFFLLIVLISCSNKGETDHQTKTTLNSGVLKVLADDTFKPILGTSIETFETLAPDAKIEVEYTAQEKAFAALLDRKTDVIIAGRPLNKSEESVVKYKGLFPKVNRIASDGLVFLVSKESAMENISEGKIKGILEGTAKIKLICDKSSSANIMYLIQKFNLSNKVSDVEAAGSDSAVISYVADHPELSCIGITGMAMVSDLDDPKVKNRLSNVKLLSIEYKDSTGKQVTGFPTLENLALKKYPFIRDIFIINLDGNTNLGTGFANFMVGETAQRIVLKSGLLPNKMPGREIMINY